MRVVLRAEKIGHVLPIINDGKLHPLPFFGHPSLASRLTVDEDIRAARMSSSLMPFIMTLPSLSIFLALQIDHRKSRGIE